jgi:hypothetical protein
MKTQKPIHSLLPFTIATAFMLITSAPAQDISSKVQPLSLAPADTEAAGDTAMDQQNEAAELAKKLQNPVANLISVPIQNNWDFGIGPANAMKYTANIQPVIPISLNDDWNLITRTILPVIYAESPVKGGESHYGLGDITQSFFLSPKNPVGGWILGAGPVALWPTATDSALGSGKWGMGPTMVALQQKDGFTYGILANQIWSYAGWGPQNVSATFLQPFFNYTTKTYTTFGVNTESTYNWESSQWTVPLNWSVQQLVKIGKMPIAFQVGYRYYAQRPANGPDWGLRFSVTFLFPKK